jgi:transcriptional regulator with XRE-family HTH domain
MSKKRATPIKRQRGPRGVGSIDKYFGDRMRARRLMIKMSQDDLAKSLGLSFQQVQKYEKGVNRISAASMVRIAEILDIDVGYFYDEMPKTNRSGAIETPALTELAISLHGRRMIDAFLNLKNDKMRAAVADLVQSLAR